MAKVSEIQQLGNVNNPDAKKVRIVHLSDSHLKHDFYTSTIPDGDILIHSGDFCKTGWGNLFKSPDVDDHIRQINKFFETIPHKHKIFVGGNHDKVLTLRSLEQTQRLIPEVTYLQDSGVEIEGINIYGSPWTGFKWTSNNKAFTEYYGHLDGHWKRIPDSTDILVTHMPPHGIMDYAREKFKLFRQRRARPCQYCDNQIHPELGHLGCSSLREEIFTRIRPMLHLFGHAHGSSGIQMHDGIVFSNAALPVYKTINVFDVFV